MIKSENEVIEKNEINQKKRAKIGKTFGLVGMIANILLATGKLIAGISIASVSVIADALNNYSDAVSSIVTLVGFRLSEKPADGDHPFGHARYEYISALTVAIMIIVVGTELAKNSLEKIFDPTPVELNTVTVCILAASIAVKLALAISGAVTGKKIGSETLTATAEDSRNDVIATTVILISAITEHFADIRIDGFAGLAVSVFVLAGGISLVKKTISPLLGEGASPELRKSIIEYIDSQPKIIGCHDLLVHDYGHDRCFASIHVELDKDEDPLVCHRIIDNIERECQKRFGVHLVVHYDPVITDDPASDRMKHLVNTILQIRDERLTVHDFRMTSGDCATRLEFDVCLPTELQGQEEDIKSSLENALVSIDTGKKGNMKYIVDITFDPAET